MRIKIISTLIILFLFFTGCGGTGTTPNTTEDDIQASMEEATVQETSGDKPEWVEGERDPDAFIGMGEAESLDKAKELAQADTSSQISRTVTSTVFSDFTKYLESSDEGIKKKIQENVQVSSKAILENLKETDSYWEKLSNGKYRYYSFSVYTQEEIDKAREKIMTHYKSIADSSLDLYKRAQKFKEIGDYNTYLSNLVNAYINLVSIGFYTFEYEDSDYMDNEFLKSIIKSEIDSIKSNTEAKIIGGNNQQVITGESLADPLVVKVYYKDGTKTVPLKGMKVDFSMEEENGKLDYSNTTTEEGIAQCTISNVRKANDNNIVRATFVYERDGVEIPFNKTSALFNFTSKASSFLVLTLVEYMDEDENFEIMDKNSVRLDVIKALREQGFENLVDDDKIYQGLNIAKNSFMTIHSGDRDAIKKLRNETLAGTIMTVYVRSRHYGIEDYTQFGMDDKTISYYTVIETKVISGKTSEIVHSETITKESAKKPGYKGAEYLGSGKNSFEIARDKSILKAMSALIEAIKNNITPQKILK